MINCAKSVPFFSIFPRECERSEFDAIFILIALFGCPLILWNPLILMFVVYCALRK